MDNNRIQGMIISSIIVDGRITQWGLTNQVFFVVSGDLRNKHMVSMEEKQDVDLSLRIVICKKNGL